VSKSTIQIQRRSLLYITLPEAIVVVESSEEDDSATVLLLEPSEIATGAAPSSDKYRRRGD